MRTVLAAVLCLLIPVAAAAQTIQGCTKIERQAIEESLRNAKRLTMDAAAAVGDTPAYTRWFGHYSPSKSEVVRANLKAIFTAIRTGRIAATCAANGVGSCDGRTYAFVRPNRHYEVFVCPPFFDLPTMASLRPEETSGDNGTREGTFIHEISHFDRVAGTIDSCYSRTECAQMARSDTLSALRNADSYQYFTEDVTHFRQVPLADKPGD